MKIWQLGLLNISLFISANSFAGTVQIPNSFNSGTPAVAAEVNDNFTAVKTAVDDNNQNITDNTSAIDLVNSRITSNASEININSKNLTTFQDNLSATSCAGFSYVKGFDINNNVICSDDLPGSGYFRKLPVFQDNIATLEISGYTVNNPVVIISGIGISIDRIEQFIKFAPNFVPGLNMEDDLVIEVNLADEAGLQAMFDSPPANRSDMSLIVTDLKDAEVFRYNFFEYEVAGYTDVGNGRARFTFTQALNSNNTLQIQTGQNNTFGSQVSDNPATDTLTEISGVISNFYPQVEDNTVNRTLTLTYDIKEGSGLYDWFRVTAAGTDNNRDVSVIQQTKGVETSRQNYFEVFPIRWEIYDGFSLPEKIRARIVLSYDESEVLP